MLTYCGTSSDDQYDSRDAADLGAPYDDAATACYLFLCLYSLIMLLIYTYFHSSTVAPVTPGMSLGITLCSATLRQCAMHHWIEWTILYTMVPSKIVESTSHDDDFEGAVGLNRIFVVPRMDGAATKSLGLDYTIPSCSEKTCCNYLLTHWIEMSYAPLDRAPDSLYDGSLEALRVNMSCR